MASFYEVPVNILFDEDEMCVYVKIYANSIDEAEVKAKDFVLSNIEIEVDPDDVIKV